VLRAEKPHTAKTWNTAFQQAIREHSYNRDQITRREIEPHYLTYSNVGWSDNRAFVWSAPASFQDLGPLGDAQGFANSINGAGAIAGSAWPRALLWQAGQMLQLDTLPGYSSSQAYDINLSGTIAGFVESSATNPGGLPDAPGVPAARAGRGELLKHRE
jgi:hypothetical protein